jgi:amidase
MPGAYVGPTELVVAGPLARSAKDLQLALGIIGGPLPEDAIAYGWKLPPPRRKTIREYRIGFALDHPLCPVTKDVTGRLQAAVDALRRAGVQVEEGFPKTVDAREQYKSFLEILWPMDLDEATEEEKARIRALKPAPDDLLASTMQHALDAPAEEKATARSKRVPMRLAWQQYFADHDAFLMPTDFLPAFPHDHREPQWVRTLATPEGARSYFDQNMWSSFAIMTGLPATVAPVGLTPSGLPVGIQIIGPWLEDATPIFVAGALEQIFGFRVPKGFE